MALLFGATFSLILAAVCGSHPYLVGGHLDNTKDHQLSVDDAAPVIISRRADIDDLDLDLDLTAEESVVEPHTDDQPEARYRNPFPFAFNGGKPFSLEKDPITGQIDFEKAPPLKAINMTDNEEDEFEEQESASAKEVSYLKRNQGKNEIAVGPNEINPYSPSFHDFLNLPVHYSSEKYGKEKYPLISSSYANTKVQSGSNLYSTYNHRPYDEATTKSSNVITRRAYTTEPTTTTTEPTTTTTTTTETVRTTTQRKTTSTHAAPTITTYKPSTKTTSRYEEYEDILPIEKLQTQKFGKDRRGPNDVSHSTKPPIDEYMYDYEEEHPEHYDIVTISPKEKTVATTTTPEISKTYPTSSASSLSTQEALMEKFTKAPQVISHVTSMPLDNQNSMESHENVHRPDFFNTVISGPGHIHFPNSPVGGVLPESTSNIVIPPDQDTVSFVLGNLQNVEGSYYTHGENTYSGVIGEGAFRPVISSSGQQGGSPDGRVTIALPSVAVVDHVSNPEWYKPRPSSAPISNSHIHISNSPSNSAIPNSVIPSSANSPITNEIPSGLRPPTEERLEPNKDDHQKGYVVFPGPTKSQEQQQPVEEHVVVINEADGTIQEFTNSTTKPVNPIELPQPAEDLTPPERPRPPPGQRPYFQYHPRPELARPSRLPLPPRTKPSPDVIFKRRPLSPDTKLPNILPQFRPNAKASHGHRGSETMGTLSANAHYRPRPSSSRRPSPPPSYLQILSPPPRPSGLQRVDHRITNPPKDLANLDKRIRLPVNPQANAPRENERVQQQNFPALGQKQNIHQGEDRVDRFSVDPPQVPPRPLLFPRHRTDDNVPRIATLQMIQQRGGLDENVVRSNLPPPLRGDLRDKNGDQNQTEAERRKDDFRNHEDIPDTPVYVVYPVNTALNIGHDDSRERDSSVVVGTRGPHRPLPPDTLLQDENQENLEPIVAPPSSVVVPNFPYPLERPDPALLSGPVDETPLLVPSDQKQQEEGDGNGNLNHDQDNHDEDSISEDFVPLKNAISATLHRLPQNIQSNIQTSTPIAYVFTPTEPRVNFSDFDDSIYKFDRNEKPVLLPSQQPSSSSSSAPSPQNFMAPFVASANAEAPPKNGWNVVASQANDRSGTDESGKDTLTAEETQTERSEFDPDNFKPQLFGGFKPIYEFPTEDEQDQREKEVKDMPRSLA